eukprot:COSAG06_NODE_2526_length_6722_cov_4.409180_6_plen_185_part_00
MLSSGATAGGDGSTASILASAATVAYQSQIAASPSSFFPRIFGGSSGPDTNVETLCPPSLQCALCHACDAFRSNLPQNASFLFLDFSEVCPEPVLAKRSRFSLSENALNTNEESALSPVGAFTAAKWSVRTASTVAYAKSHSFFEFSLCSSRACLGKMIILCINGAKRRGFRTWAATCRKASLF